MKTFWAAVVVASIVFGAGVGVGHYVWTGLPTIAEHVGYTPPPPLVLPAPPKVRKAKRKPVSPQRCAQLTEIADPDLLSGYARRFGIAGLATGEVSLLTSGMIPRTRWGGEVIGTVEDDQPVERLTFVEGAPPRFAFRRDWRFEAGVGGAISNRIDGAVAPAAYVSLDLRLLQTSRVDHGLRASAILTKDNPTAYVGYVAGWGDY